jgi:hypothetical protein
MIATVTRAGQVTVWAFRSTRNWPLANRPPGADGTWVVTIGVRPCWSSQARLAPVPEALSPETTAWAAGSPARGQVAEQRGRNHRVAGGRRG